MLWGERRGEGGNILSIFQELKQIWIRTLLRQLSLTVLTNCTGAKGNSTRVDSGSGQMKVSPVSGNF